jgi:hypothetical protein
LATQHLAELSFGQATQHFAEQLSNLLERLGTCLDKQARQSSSWLDKKQAKRLSIWLDKQARRLSSWLD